MHEMSNKYPANIQISKYPANKYLFAEYFQNHPLSISDSYLSLQIQFAQKTTCTICPTSFICLTLSHSSPSNGFKNLSGLQEVWPKRRFDLKRLISSSNIWRKKTHKFVFFSRIWTEICVRNSFSVLDWVLFDALFVHFHKRSGWYRQILFRKWNNKWTREFKTLMNWAWPIKVLESQDKAFGTVSAKCVF